MKLLSQAFINNGAIPSMYTCDGENVSPPLQVLDTPESAKSLVLIVDDPDAPSGTWVHWLVWNIDPKVRKIEQNTVPLGGVQGTTSFDETGFGGPCPPVGTHRYFFKIYAISKVLDFPTSARKSDIEKAIEPFVIDSDELVGLYERG